ncbi:DUF1593 domain-containing protein [Roseateles cellulosilyticus]|uniref:DUF1593 domain-containing protein n=1 Tax=Pelomonas cellulosilytica TaxID=2906762 RepID=A0ABS8XJN9_9BURK|nr:nucleoside hydrolase-like domain-containing protein [Pelomonas sp. P8]MCE4553069.1 DUF1593 domain-containing protein [Pelomonas sp. P8]
MTIRTTGVRWLLLIGLSWGELPAPAAEPPARERARLIVLTDVENEPDDTQSLVRLLLYANDIELQGLVATTSVHMKDAIHPASIERVIDRYAQVLPRLRQHDRAYPSAAALRALVRSGQPAYGMAAVGEGRDTPGSRLILQALASPDPRPLWVAVWGGANTLAQALSTLAAQREPAELARFIARLRIYTISDQDDSGAWLRRRFPELFYIVSPGGYGNAIWGGINQPVPGIDNSRVSNAWLARHIQQGHGPLGAAYPDVAYGMEGDTPSFLGLIPNGLNAPENPDWGGWGGRYERYTPRLEDTDPQGFTGGVQVEAETRPIWTNAKDRYRPFVEAEFGRAVKPSEQVFEDAKVTLWRWRDDFQNDFAARIGWTTQPVDRANHPPDVRLAQPDRLTVAGGSWVELDARASRDPDGDSLSFLWFHYPEAGSWKTALPLGTENLARIRFQAPAVTKTETAHIILRVTDKGSPALSRYRRIILTITPGG